MNNMQAPIAETPMYADKALGELILQFQQQPTVPLLSVITQKTKALSMAEAKRRQDAMSANAQQGPQTIAQQGLQAGLQALAQSQGGIQALASGGPVQSFAEGGQTSPAGRWFSGVQQDIQQRVAEQREMEALRLAVREQFSRSASPMGLFKPQTDEERARAVEVMRALPNMSKAELQAVLAQAPAASAPAAAPAAAPADQTRPTPQEIERAVRTAPAGVAALPAAPGRAAPAAPAAAAAPGRAAPAGGPAPGSLEALLMRQAQGDLPEITALEKEAANNARRQREMLERMQEVPPEVAAARKRYEETMRGLYEPQRKAAEEARAATKQGLLSSPEALARLAAALSDPSVKTFGQGLGRGAAAVGEVLGDRRKRAEELEGKYWTLAAQRDMTLAQAALADANGDEKRKQEMLRRAQEIDDNLLNIKRELFKTRTTTQQQGVAGLTGLMSARAQLAQANRPTEIQQRQELYRKDPNAYEAMYGSKEAERLAKIQAVVARDPLLVKYAEQAALNMPGAREKYNAQYTSLMARHAPELAGIAVTTSPPAGAQILK